MCQIFSFNRQNTLPWNPSILSTIDSEKGPNEDEENNRGRSNADLHDSHSIEKSAASILKCTTTTILGNCII